MVQLTGLLDGLTIHFMHLSLGYLDEADLEFN